MNRVDLKELGASITTPSLTVLISMKFERRRVEKFHHIVGKALAELRERYPNDLTGILLDAQALLSQIDITEGESVAVFLNKYIARTYSVPFDLPDTIHIDKIFYTQPITARLDRLDFGWVMVIRHHVPYLFEAYEQGLVEVVHRHHTWQGDEISKLSNVAGDVCTIDMAQWHSGCRYASEEEFIKKIDTFVQQFLTGYTSDNGVAGHGNIAPLVLVAVDSMIKNFKRYSVYGDFVITLSATEQLFAPAELLKRAWPLIEKHYKHWEREDLQELKAAAQAKLVVQGAEAVWKAVRQDRVRLLCVERDLKQPGCEDLATTIAKPGSSCGSLRAIDMVDEIIALARRKGIRVSLYEHGRLLTYDRIAAILTD